MEECNYCHESVEDAEKCGLNEVGDQCACCGRVLLDKQKDDTQVPEAEL